MDKKKYVRVDPFTGFPEKDVKEDAPTTSTAGVAATGDDPTVVVRKKKKLYDGRTRIAKKFVERILKQREARKVTEEVELDEVLKPKDKKVIDDFVQANKGTGAQNFTKRGNMVDYEGRSLEKSGMGAQQIASIESDPKDSHKIKVHAKMDSRSTQSIVNYLKKSAKKYNIKVEETVKEEPMINEKIEYVEYKFRNKNDAIKAQKYFMKQNQGPDYEFMDDDINNGTLGVDAGKDDMTKHHNEVMRKFKPKIVSKENVEFDDLEEAVANLFVKGDNPNQMALKIAKNAKGLGLKSAMMGNQVRVKGSQKQVNDFMRSVLGKSSMGSPTEKGASNPQIDKMLNKQLKEDVFRSNDFVGKIMEKVNDFGNEHELVETNLKVLQNIVKKKQNQKVKFKDKQATVDLFTASAIMKVYDAVKPDNKKKIEKLMNGTLVDFLKLQKFAMKQVKFA
mgnify:CR=1 FL=1|jgi:hypothetical protein|tara:strand:- start:4456 stop:5802 length:1347 start_codon:yes stop_codon:yes gene_type:complete